MAVLLRWSACGFLLVFHSIHSPKSTVFGLWAWDRQIDGWTAALLNAPYGRGIIIQTLILITLTLTLNITSNLGRTYPGGQMSGHG